MTPTLMMRDIPASRLPTPAEAAAAVKELQSYVQDRVQAVGNAATDEARHYTAFRADPTPFTFFGWRAAAEWVATERTRLDQAVSALRFAQLTTGVLAGSVVNG